jgi:hypothetical protein
MPAPVKAAKVSRTRADIADQDPAVSMKLPKPGPVAAPHAGCALADTDVQFSESSEIDGGEMFAHACKVGLEAVVSKCVTAIVCREAELRVGQKMHAAFEASASLMAGASGNEIVLSIDGMSRRMRSDWAGSIRVGVENVRSGGSLSRRN